MTECRWLPILVMLLFSPAYADEDKQDLIVGYLELADDPRYTERTAYARIQLRAESRPWPGAELAVADSRITTRMLGISIALKRHRARDLDDLARTLQAWQEDHGIQFVLLDLPHAMVAELARRTRASKLLLFNVSASESALRRRQCAEHLFHALPDDAMKTDALVQYLVSRNWKRILVLRGPRAADRRLVDALVSSSRRFGAEIVGIREYRDGNDPRERDHNNVALLTTGDDYDAVFVADVEGEIGRYVPYRTYLPRPVVGTAGLRARAWSAVYERHGAPQVNDRFERHAGRRMEDADWAAWIAVNAIVQSALRSGTTRVEDIARHMRNDALRLDGAKGPALSFRTWNNQLRQPILLATHDAVIGRAPVEGFLHPVEYMDTLGDDAGETTCRF